MLSSDEPPKAHSVGAGQATTSEESWWSAQVRDPKAKRVFAALASPPKPAWKFRTALGLASATGLTEQEVQAAIEEYAHLIRRTQNRNCEALFALVVPDGARHPPAMGRQTVTIAKFEPFGGNVNEGDNHNNRIAVLTDDTRLWVAMSGISALHEAGDPEQYYRKRLSSMREETLRKLLRDNQEVRVDREYVFAAGNGTRRYPRLTFL